MRVVGLWYQNMSRQVEGNISRINREREVHIYIYIYMEMMISGIKKIIQQ